MNYFPISFQFRLYLHPWFRFSSLKLISTGLNLVSLTHTTRNYQQQKKVFLREGKKSEMRRKQRLWLEEQQRRSSVSFSGFSLRNFNLSFRLVWEISLTYRYNLLLLLKFNFYLFVSREGFAKNEILALDFEQWSRMK